jgi:hypothetical protein
MKPFCLVFILAIVLTCFEIPIRANGEESQFEDERNHLYIHIIPHSHCDPGWLKTYKVFNYLTVSIYLLFCIFSPNFFFWSTFSVCFQEYYAQNVKPILTNIFNQIKSDPTKTFNWAEM